MIIKHYKSITMTLINSKFLQFVVRWERLERPSPTRMPGIQNNSGEFNFCFDDKKLALSLPREENGSLPVNKSNYITTLRVSEVLCARVSAFTAVRLLLGISKHWKMISGIKGQKFTSFLTGHLAWRWLSTNKLTFYLFYCNTINCCHPNPSSY